MKKNGWSCRLVAVSWVCLFVLGACAQPVVSDGDKGVEAAAPALVSEVAYAQGAGRFFCGSRKDGRMKYRRRLMMAHSASSSGRTRIRQDACG